MKKTYFSPATEVLQFDTEEMMAASMPGVVTGTPADADAEVLSTDHKTSSIWDDED